MDEGRLDYAGWRVATASSVGVLFASFFFLSFAVFLKPLSTEFGWTREAVSAAYAVMTIAAALSAPVVGYLLDRHGPRRVCAPCLAGAALAFASLSVLTPRLPHLYATFAIIGLAVMGTGPVVYSRIVSTWFDQRRGTALAVVVSGAAIGGIVHPSMTQALVGSLGWRSAALALGAAIVAIGVPVTLLFVRQNSDRELSGSLTSEPGFRAALGTRVFWTLVAIVFGSTMAMNGTIVHLQALFTDRGLSPTQSAAIGSVIGVAGLFGRLVTGTLIDRFDATRVAFALLCLVAVGTALLTSALTLPLVIAGSLLIGFGAGGELDAVPYLVSRYFGIQSMAALYGLVWSAWGVAGAIGSVVMGRMYDTTGTYDGALVRFAVASAFAAALMLTLPACRPRRAAAAVGV
jgi:sugar phosphate permease